MNQGVYASFMRNRSFGNQRQRHARPPVFVQRRQKCSRPEGKYFLSKLARSYVAGLLKYAPEITAVNNQWINSYKRLVPGYEAPVYLSWAKRNRSDMIRVPEYRPVRRRLQESSCGHRTRLVSLPVLQRMLAAGMKGIEDGLEPPEPIEEMFTK